MNYLRTILIAILVQNVPLFGQHQTETLSPVITDGFLPYQFDLVPYDTGNMPLPTLHSYAKAQWEGKWLLIGGRTNGLHAFTQNGFANFPPAFENRDVWVIDPVNGQSWRRSLEDADSGLEIEQIDSLAVTNNQFYQSGDRLYITGGYGYKTDFDFTTFDTLTSVDVPGLIDWVQGAEGTAATNLRQFHDPLFAVTGGAMYEMSGRTHLVFGQDFQGEYTPFGNGVYTNQVRSFSIIDDESTLSIEDVTSSEPNESFRRRDLNVIPVIRAENDGSLSEELRVLSGVFTEAGGAWTVPVEVNAAGEPFMPDPTDETTFKQAMNAYHSAKIGLYSEVTNGMHMLLFGGISLNYFDHETQQLVRDDQLPFINQVTSIVIDDEENYTQHLLPTEFPEILDEESGKRLLFGTNAEFMLADGIDVYDNGVIKIDEINEPTVLGFIVGGIAADQPNNGNSAASGQIFQVRYTPVDAIDGDLNRDGWVNEKDINLLARERRTADPSIYFDINDSNNVDEDDLRHLVEEIINTWFGDANLDGEFNSADLVHVFQFGEYEDGIVANSQWETGDWNGDGEFDSADFVAAFQANGYENGPKILAVPESNSLWNLTWILFITCVRYRSRSSQSIAV